MASMPEMVVSVRVSEAVVALTKIRALASGEVGRGMTSADRLAAVEAVAQEALAKAAVVEAASPDVWPIAPATPEQVSDLREALATRAAPTFAGVAEKLAPGSLPGPDDPMHCVCGWQGTFAQCAVRVDEVVKCPRCAYPALRGAP